MVDNTKSKMIIREFVEGKDKELVENLEKKCEIGSNKGVSIFTCMMADPLCRIRFYPFHVMLVAELRESRELVGVVRGCIKFVGTSFGGTFFNMGCILGLRVSPAHRRMGIGLKLVKSVEDWMARHGADYIFLATDKSNKASTNLFTLKCNYMELSSLVILMQPLTKNPSQHITTEKLHVNDAIALYKNKLKTKHIYPTDMDSILQERLSLGTWVSYFKNDQWNVNQNGLREKDKNHTDQNNNNNVITPSSWVMFSLWNTSEAYKLQIRKGQPLKFLHSTISHAMDKFFPRMKLPIFMCESVMEKPFGFLFVYGIHGEGERAGELVRSVWDLASRVAESMKGSNVKVIMTELGVSDPLIEHVPREPSMSRINDAWYLKKAKERDNESEDEVIVKGRDFGNVFVDPRDF